MRITNAAAKAATTRQPITIPTISPALKDDLLWWAFLLLEPPLEEPPLAEPPAIVGDADGAVDGAGVGAGEGLRAKIQ